MAWRGENPWLGSELFGKQPGVLVEQPRSHDKQHRVQKAAAEQRLYRLSGRLPHPPDTYHRHMHLYTQTPMYACMYMFTDFKTT